MLAAFAFLCIAARWMGAVGQMQRCYEGVDIVQVQDMTSSFDSRWPKMARQLPRIIQKILTVHSQSAYAFATFGDKNLDGVDHDGKDHILGYDTDYCAHVDVPLSRPNETELVDLFFNYASNAAGGGGDWPEAVLEGLYRSLASPKLNWRTATRGQTGLPSIARLAVLVTDATSHLNGDVDFLTGNKVPPFIWNPMQVDENYKCGAMDYPSVEQVVDFIKSMNINLIIFVAPGGSVDPDGTFVPSKSLADKGPKYRRVDGLKLWYEDLMAAAGLPGVVVEQLDPDMKVYADAFERALDGLSKNFCGETTTTIAPSTTSSSSSSRTEATQEAPETPTEVATEVPDPTTEDGGDGEGGCGCCEDGCYHHIRIRVNVE